MVSIYFFILLMVLQIIIIALVIFRLWKLGLRSGKGLMALIHTHKGCCGQNFHRLEKRPQKEMLLQRKKPSESDFASLHLTTQA